MYTFNVSYDSGDSVHHGHPPCWETQLAQDENTWKFNRIAGAHLHLFAGHAGNIFLIPCQILLLVELSHFDLPECKSWKVALDDVSTVLQQIERGVAVVKSSVTSALSLYIKDNFAPFPSQSKRVDDLQHRCIRRHVPCERLAGAATFPHSIRGPCCSPYDGSAHLIRRFAVAQTTRVLAYSVFFVVLNVFRMLIVGVGRRCRSAGHWDSRPYSARDVTSLVRGLEIEAWVFYLFFYSTSLYWQRNLDAFSNATASRRLTATVRRASHEGKPLRLLLHHFCTYAPAHTRTYVRG